MAQLLKPTPDWKVHEKPGLPGSPSMPYHTPLVRLAYAAVALLVGITGGLGNALVSANLPTIQGQLGLTPSEGIWLPAAFAMVNITVNLLIFKFRQQYGMHLFTEIGLGLYAAVTLLHLLVGGFGSTPPGFPAPGDAQHAAGQPVRQRARLRPGVGMEHRRERAGAAFLGRTTDGPI